VNISQCFVVDCNKVTIFKRCTRASRASVKKSSGVLKISLKRRGTGRDVQVVDHGTPAQIVRDSRAIRASVRIDPGPRRTCARVCSTARDMRPASYRRPFIFLPGC